MGFVAEWAGPIDTLCGIPIPGLLQVEQDQPISLILFEHLLLQPKDSGQVAASDIHCDLAGIF